MRTTPRPSRAPLSHPRFAPPAPRKGRAGEQGSAAPIILGMTLVMLVVSVGVFTFSEGQSRTVVGDGKHLSAVNIAEAGIDHILWRLRQPADGEGHYGPLWDTLSDEQDVPLGNGVYHLKEVTRQGGYLKSLRIEGWIPNRTASNAVRAEIVAEVSPNYNSLFNYAAFGDEGVRMGNGNTDSYDSRLGGYYSTSHGSNGDVGTNATHSGALSVGPNGEIDGDAIHPRNASASVVSSKGAITGSIGPADGDTAFRPIPEPPSTAVRVRAVSASGQSNVRLQRVDDGSYIEPPIAPGDYVIESSGGASVRLSGKAELNFSATGVTRLWLEGDLVIGGKGIANAYQLPPHLLIYGMPPGYAPGVPGCRSVTISGNGQLFAAVYAPKADITINGGGATGDVFGSLVGKTITMNGNGTFFHYDEALAHVEGGVSSYRLNTWTQIK
jgi:hypothetical protein